MDFKITPTNIEVNFIPLDLEVTEEIKGLEAGGTPVTNSANVVNSDPNIIASGGGSIIKGFLKTQNFNAGVSGWSIDGNGDVEFNSGTFRGALVANSLDVPDITTADSFHIDTTGNTWWGGALIGDAQAKVLKTGVATFASIAINGGTINGVAVADVGYVTDPTLNIVPEGLTCSETTATVASDGSVSAQVVLTWTAISTNTFSHYNIRYKKTAATYYTYLTAKTNTITIEGLVPNVSYVFGLAAVNKSGVSSVFSSDISQTTATSTTAPATVTSGSATAGIQYVIIEWTHNTESDLASYNIYRKTTNDASTSDLIGNSRTNYFVDGGRTGGQIYYYWVKAINTSGLLSAAYSTTVSATPRDVGDADIASTAAIAATKVLIDGAVYLSNWRHTSDITKIDGGDIYTGSVTTTQLNFTPVQSTDVIASINSSAEGITIDADNITINAATTFAAGYDPTAKVTTFAQNEIPISVAAGDLWIDTNDGNKLYRAASAGADEITAGEWILLETASITVFAQDAVPTSLAEGDLWFDTDDGNKQYRAAMIGADEITAGEWEIVTDDNKLDILGGSYDTAASGARVRIFPDANTGIQIIDDATNDVFKAIVGGTDVGDVIMGNETINQYAKWDKSAATFIVNGSPIAQEFLYGDGSDGDVVISSNTSLTSDMFYDDLTISAGYTLTTNGYRVFIKGILTIEATGKIDWSGKNGGDGGTGGTPGAGAAGTAGASLADGYLSGSVVGVVGGAGGAGAGAFPVAGVNGNTGTAGRVGSFGSNGTAGGAGGSGGENGAAGGSAGAGGTEGTAASMFPRNAFLAISMIDDSDPTSPIPFTINAAPGSGAGGGGGEKNGSGTAGGGGGGGGSASAGGIGLICCRFLVNGGTISFNGGDGGDGGTGGAANDVDVDGGGGGGGGGAGGNGGFLCLIYNKKSGAGTITVAAGAAGGAGSGGAGAGGGSNGNPGSAGNAGTVGTLIELTV